MAECAIQAIAPWKQTAVVCESQGSWWLSWVHEEERVCTVCINDGLLRHVPYVQMGQPQLWALDLWAQQEYIDVHLSVLQKWIQQLWEEYGVLLSVCRLVEVEYGRQFAGLV